MSKNNNLKKIVGLTGGIGVGKSLVAQIFSRHGIPTVDADQIAKKLREPGQPGYIEIEKRFGTHDRQKLREIITKDPDAKKDLEKILHPLIAFKSDEQFQALHLQNPKAPFILYEASLLIEAGRAKDFNHLIVVTSPLQDRILRITKRDSCSELQAKAMINSQMSDEERLKFATHHIINDQTPEVLALSVKKVLDQILSP